MNWTLAIDRQRTALAGILAALFAMAGIAAGPHPEVRAEGEPRRTLPRHLHRAVLRLLRPAEAAARRLVIAVARTLPATAPRPLPPAPPPTPASRTGIVMPAAGPAVPPARRAKLSLPLVDPLRTKLAPGRHPSKGVPRISVPGVAPPFPLPVRPPLAPDDPLDAGRLNLRLRALAAALDDLPAAARRFARWRASRAVARLDHRRPCRVWPLRPGRPPGWSRRSSHAVHEVLADTQWLALQALRDPDTS